MTEINKGIEEVKKIVLSVWREEISVNKGVEQICHLFPQPLDDKELREKIAKVLWNVQFAYELTDQILALLQPKIEEAKRQGIEKALKAMEIYDGQLKPNPYTTLEQALRGKVNDQVE